MCFHFPLHPLAGALRRLLKIRMGREFSGKDEDENIFRRYTGIGTPPNANSAIVPSGICSDTDRAIFGVCTRGAKAGNRDVLVCRPAIGNRHTICGRRHIAAGVTARDTATTAICVLARIVACIGATAGRPGVRTVVRVRDCSTLLRICGRERQHKDDSKDEQSPHWRLLTRERAQPCSPSRTRCGATGE